MRVGAPVVAWGDAHDELRSRVGDLASLRCGSLRAALEETAKAFSETEGVKIEPVLASARPASYRFAMYILAEGQRILARHGFSAPALPQEGSKP